MIQEFGLGAFMGFRLFALVIAMLWLLGVYPINDFEVAWLSLIGGLTGAFVSAFAQELIFRGIL